MMWTAVQKGQMAPIMNSAKTRYATKHIPKTWRWKTAETSFAPCPTASWVSERAKRSPRRRTLKRMPKAATGTPKSSEKMLLLTLLHETSVPMSQKD